MTITVKKSRIVYIAAIIIAAAAMLVFSDKSAVLAADAMNTCAKVVVPSLFPYMVISSLVISSGAADYLGILARPVTKLLRLPRCCGTAFVLGALCGFPIGAMSAVNLYDRGQITKSQCERLIAVSNNTGPAFVIGVVGTAFWNSRDFGIMLYAVQLLAAVIAALILFSGKSCDNTDKDGEVSAVHSQSSRSVADEITGAITSSTHSILAVCGYVVFFSVAVGLVKDGLDAVGAHESISLIISSFAEFTAGSRYAASFGGAVGMATAGFAIGWSGLSVFFQSSAFTLKSGLSLAPAVKCKLLQGGICSAICAVFGEKLIPFPSDSPVIKLYSNPNPTVTAAVFIVILIVNATAMINKISKESI